MRTANGVQECAESDLNRRRFVRTANGHLGLWELAFLLPTPHYTYCCHARALPSSGRKPRFSDGRAQEKACTDAQDRSHIATARGRSRSCTQGGGNAAGGSRRENVDYQERRVASGERRVHSSDAKHYRESCGRCGCPCRDPRAEKAVAPTSSSEAGRKIVRPRRVGCCRSIHDDDRRLYAPHLPFALGRQL